ncbi:MAG: AbrB/MazE/SpoVT family DNA-binding domain-containing protein [Propionibacteriaceae bacterium]|jgi:AbrB family looped-hinge helix DNA binding protein|nr:AbrB/MazE/SpoVT family DNA-binding domain-containing protein [Propionibacteriaceae bacterium]
MPTATLTSKGQITLPAEVRRKLGLRQGSSVHFIPDGDGYRIEVRSTRARDLAGLLPKPARPVTLAQMNAAIAAAALESRP